MAAKALFGFLFLVAVCTVAHSAFLYGHGLERAGLISGTLSPTDKLLTKQNISAKAVPNKIIEQNVTFTGNRVNITYITALEVGLSQNANAYIVAGGVGYSNVTLLLRSQLGRGYNYTISIYGKNL